MAECLKAEYFEIITIIIINWKKNSDVYHYLAHIYNKFMIECAAILKTQYANKYHKDADRTVILKG